MLYELDLTTDAGKQLLKKMFYANSTYESIQGFMGNGVSVDGACRRQAQELALNPYDDVRSDGYVDEDLATNEYIRLWLQEHKIRINR